MFFLQRMGRALSAAAMALSCLVATPSLACSVCGCGDPLVVAGDARPIPGNLRLALEADYLSASARSDDDASLTEGVRQYTLRPVVVWSPLDTLSLVLQVPFVRKDWELRGADLPSAVSNTGLGDVDVGARWFPWQRTSLHEMSRQGLGFSAGTSLPTGADDLKFQGARIDDHAQLGTGSFGAYVGALYAFHRDPWNLSVNASIRAHSTNSYGYNYGTAALWSVRGTYRLVERLAFVAGVDGRFAGRDSAQDKLQTNTGGLLLAAVPGVAANLFDNLWVHFTVQLPVVKHLFGSQTVGPVASLSLQYSFQS